MSKRAQKARKTRLAKESKDFQDPRAQAPSLLLNIPSEDSRPGGYFRNPWLYWGLAVLAGVVGVVWFTPVLLICVISVPLGLYQSKVLKGHGALYQLNAYAMAFLLLGGVVLGAEALARKPVRDYVRQIASDAAPQPKVPNINTKPPAPPNPVPMPGQLFHSFGFNQPPLPDPANANRRARPVPAVQHDPNSPEGALEKEMRERLTRDAGDPEKIVLDVKWMREQFEMGWQLEPPELARKHEAETEQTARLILANASNRQAILQLIPHITIDK